MTWLVRNADKDTANMALCKTAVRAHKCMRLPSPGAPGAIGQWKTHPHPPGGGLMLIRPNLGFLGGSDIYTTARLNKYSWFATDPFYHWDLNLSCYIQYSTYFDP